MQYIRMTRPRAGQHEFCVLLDGLVDVRLHWVDGGSVPCQSPGASCNKKHCTNTGRRAYHRWYGPAAELIHETIYPTNEQEAAYQLRKKTGQACQPPRPTSLYRPSGHLVIAEVADREVTKLPEEKRGAILMLGRAKGEYGAVFVKVLGAWREDESQRFGLLAPPFDVLPYLERILGAPIQSVDAAEVANEEAPEAPPTLRGPWRAQA